MMDRVLEDLKNGIRIEDMVPHTSYEPTDEELAWMNLEPVGAEIIDE